MSDQGHTSPASILRKRYLRILKDTVRRELDNQLLRHLSEQNPQNGRRENFERYLSILGISCEINSDEPAWQAAKNAVKQCNAIRDWFNLTEFWESQLIQTDGQHGTKHYQALLTKLIVRLHGFWVFTLDDTSHTFRFVPVASECNEWGRLDEAKRENLDDWRKASIHFGEGVYFKTGTTTGSNDLKDILQEFLKQYLLRPGEGSVGLGLRADRGVCLRDTVRDLRGAVALEDCIMRNLSYIGLPVFLQENTSLDAETILGSRGRPIGHFGIFFPSPVGWHEARKDAAEWCESCMFPCSDGATRDLNATAICLFEKAEDLNKRFVQPLLAQNYETQSDARLKEQITSIAGLGDRHDFQNRGVAPETRRKVFLEQVLPDANGDSRSVDDEPLRIEDFQAVQIWERHAAIAGLSEVAAPTALMSATWRQSVRWKYPDLFFATLRQQLTDFSLLDDADAGPWSKKADGNGQVKDGPWHALDAKRGDFVLESLPLEPRHRLIVVKEPESPSAKQFQALIDAQTFWAQVSQFIEAIEKPETAVPSLPEFRPAREGPEDSNSVKSSKTLDAHVRLMKLRRLLRCHAAQCLVARLLGKATGASLSPLLFHDTAARTRLNDLLQQVKKIAQTLSVSVLGGAGWRLESIQVGKKLEPLKSRLENELLANSHTVPVFLALAHAVERAGLFASGSPVFIANHEPTKGTSHRWPIQSEAYHDSVGGHHIDCGIETAFSIPSIWRAWCEQFANSNADLVKLGCLDRIKLEQKSGEHLITLTLSSSKDSCVDAQLSLRLVENRLSPKVFQFVLAHDADGLRDYLKAAQTRAEAERSSRCTLDDTKSDFVPRNDAPEASNTAETAIEASKAAETAMLLLAEHCSPKASDKDSPACILLAHVGGQPCLELRKLDGTSIPLEVTEDDRKAFEYIAGSLHNLLIPVGKDFGLTSHLFVPLAKPAEEARTRSARDYIGFLVFSGAQLESETIKRVEIRPAQRALVSFATDYLEYAVSQELAQHELTQSLQGFAHASRRMARYLRVGAMAPQRRSIYEKMSLLLGKPNRGNLPNTFQQIYRGQPWPDDIATQIREYIQGTAEIEQIGILKFTHAILITALTYVLAHKIEPPLPLQAGSIPDQARSFETWLLHILQSSIKAEQDDNPNARFDLRPDDQPEPAKQHEYFPAGSVCLVLQELIRNATKYGEKDTLREVTLTYTRPGYAVVSISNVVTSSKVIDSTQSGFETIENALAVNFGPTERGGWSLMRPRGRPQPGTEYKVILSLDVDVYKARCFKKP